MDADNKPVFLIGTGRNGSTILFEALAVHESLGWISQYVDRFPRWDCLAALSRIYDGPGGRRLPRAEKRQHRQGRHRLNRLLPKPVESYRKWAVLTGRPDFGRDFMTGITAEPGQVAAVRRSVGRIGRYQRRPRFIAKFTGPSRIEFLLSIFPEAHFVHMVRDPRAVVRSGLEYYARRARAGDLPPTLKPGEPLWKNGLPDDWRDELASYHNDPVAFSAMHVRAVLREIAAARRHVPPGQFMEVRYEDVVADPRQALRGILEQCRLPASERVETFVSAPGRYQSMNYKLRSDDIDPRHLALVDRVMAGPRSRTPVPG